MDTIYSKTAKGVREAAGKTRTVSRDLRTLLVAIDGKMSVSELLGKTGGWSEQDLRKALGALVADGYIREPVASAPMAGSTAAPAASVTPAEADQLADLDFTALPAGAGPDAGAARREAEARAAREATEEARRKAEERARRLGEEAVNREHEERKKREAAETASRVAEARAKRLTEEAAKRESEERAKREAAEAASRKAEAQVRRLAEEAAKRESEERARREAAEVASRQAEAQAKRLAEEAAKRESEERAKREAAEAASRKAEAQAKRLAEEAAKREREERTKREAAEAARREAEAQVKRLAAEAAKRESEERARREAAEAARRAAEAEAKRLAEEAAKREREERAKREAAEAARREAEAEAKRLAAEAAKRESEERTRREAEEAARHAAEAEAKRLAEEAAQREREERAKREAAEAARREAEAEAKRLAAEAATRESEERARREAEEAARRTADAEAKRLAEEAAKRESEERAKREAAEAAGREAEGRAQRLAREAAAREADERAAEQARREADQRARQQETEQARRLADDARRREAEEARRREDEARAARKAEERTRAAERPETAQRAVPGRGRKLFKILAGGSLLLVILGLLLLHVVSFDGRIPRFELAIAERLQQPVKIKSLHFALLPRPHWRLEGVAIGDAGQIRAPRIDAFMTTAALFGDQGTFAAIEAAAPSLTAEGLGWLLFRTQRGVEPDLVRIAAGGAKLDVVGIALPPLDIDAEIGDEGNWQRIKASSAESKVDLVLQRKGEAVELRFDAAAFAVPAADMRPLQDFSAQGTVDRDALRITEFQGRTFGGTLTGTALLQWQATPSLDGEVVAARVDVAQLLPGLFGRGALDGQGKFSLPLAEAEKPSGAPRAAGSFVIRKGALATVDLGQVLRDAGGAGRTAFAALEGDVVYDGGKTQLRRLRLDAGALSARGSVDIATDGALSGAVAVELSRGSDRHRGDFAVSGGAAARRGEGLAWRRR